MVERRWLGIMNKSINVFRAVVWAFFGSLAASCAVILLGMCVLGLNLGGWTEWEGRTAGLLATAAGVAGAAVGLKLALRRSTLTKV